MRYIIFTCLFIVTAASQAGPRETLQRFYAQTQTLRAAFQQVSISETGEVMAEHQGWLLLDRPNRFRWDYRQPYVQQLTSDGDKVWFYDQDLRQVSVRPLGDVFNSTPAALLTGMSLENAFNLSEQQDGEINWVVLTPKDNSGDFSRIRLNFVDDRLRVMELHDQFDQTTRILFSKIEANPVVDANIFVFSPPAGVEVVGETETAVE